VERREQLQESDHVASIFRTLTYYYDVLIAGISCVERLGMGRRDEIIVLPSNEQAGDEGLTDVLERVDIVDLKISLVGEAVWV
jgi:hypothetical protein